MSPPTFLTNSDLLAEATVGSVIQLDATVTHHLRVTRIRPSENIDIVDGKGKRLSGVVTSDGEFEVQGIVHEKPPALRITVAQALIKGDRLERAIEMMTEVGAQGFIPWQADHCVVNWSADKISRNLRKWESLVHASTEQSRRSFVPHVQPPMSSSELLAHFDQFDHVVVLEESSDSRGVTRYSGKILVLVGPEGGISESERTAFSAANNAASLTVGTNVLRSATAGVVGLTYLFTSSGEWNTQHVDSVAG